MLPSSQVRFPAGFLRRVELFAPKVAAARERREGAGGARLSGTGMEFVGRRPYRPGDDPRSIDWELLACEDQPWVRILHREAAESWAIVIDTSGSMGVGSPGKLQSAAEVAVAIAAVGLRVGARVSVHLTGSGGGRAAPPAGSPAGGPAGTHHRRAELRKAGDLARLLPLLEGAQAESSAAGFDAGVARLVPRDAGRVVLLGDLCEAQPTHLMGVARPGRMLVLGHVLAPEEVNPELMEAVRIRDPEGRGAVDVHLDELTQARYRSLLDREIEGWADFAARRGARHHLWLAGQPFEQPARALLEA